MKRKTKSKKIKRKRYCEICGEKKHIRQFVQFKRKIWLCPSCEEAAESESEVNPEI